MAASYSILYDTLSCDSIATIPLSSKASFKTCLDGRAVKRSAPNLLDLVPQVASLTRGRNESGYPYIVDFSLVYKCVCACKHVCVCVCETQHTMIITKISTLVSLAKYL